MGKGISGRRNSIVARKCEHMQTDSLCAFEGGKGALCGQEQGHEPCQGLQTSSLGKGKLLMGFGQKSSNIAMKERPMQIIKLMEFGGYC